ncbi:hypothetical protein ACROAD_09715 [Shewanella baltica]|uniref:hypothetical protein n=1 Tax=Shewanella baltica TaxID=62322 RepID=UPI003D7A8E7A
MDIKKNQILVITSVIDKTVDYIIKKFPQCHFFRFNVDEFSSYSVSVTNDGFSIERNGSLITSKTCLSIYFRKPQLEDLTSVLDVPYHDFVHKESYSVVEGIAEIFEGRVLTKPSIMRRANNKAFQAMLAKRVGFNLPQMSITNDVAVLANFIATTKSIVKPVAVGEVIHNNKIKEFVQTNMIDSSVSSESLKYSPVYLQHYQDKDYELRVTYVGDTEFTVRIDSDNYIDWRKPDTINTYSTCSLPENISTQCRNFMNIVGMQFGCFDFIVKDEQYYFLEMNANGQWGWLEFELQLDISLSIVEYLSGHSQTAIISSR